MTWNVINEMKNCQRRKSPLALKLKTTSGDTVVAYPQVIVEKFSLFLRKNGWFNLNMRIKLIQTFKYFFTNPFMNLIEQANQYSFHRALP